MEIHQLRYFIAVVDEGSFSRAAAREHVAQPSLSQQIQKLEAEMGERLFDRLPRSVVVTEAGKCLLEYARKILAEIADARRCVDELKGEVAGRLAVGAIPTIAPYVLPALILLPKEHQLAKKKKIKWSDLESQKFLLLHEMHCLSAQVYQFLDAHHLRPTLAVTGAQLGTIARMVAAGMGVSLVPQMMIQTELMTGCVGLPFAAPVPMRELNLVRNPLRVQSKAAEAFHQEAAAAFSSQTNAG